MDPARMPPSKYLEHVKGVLCERQLRRMRPYDELAGLRTELVGGAPYAHVVDERRYREFLCTSRHLKPEDVEQIIAKEKEVEHYFLSGISDTETRMHNAGAFARRLLPDHAQLLDGVPLGVAPLTYVHGGAIAVPSGGHVVIVSTALYCLQYWLVWLKLLVDLARRDAVLMRRLSAALPDLAQHILGDVPATGHFLYFVHYAASSEAMASPLSNRERWLAEVFILLHEYAHIVLGHTDAMRKWTPEAALRPAELRERRAMQQQFEYEADALAAAALQRVVYEEPLEPLQAVDEILDTLNGLFLLFYLGERTSQVPADLSTHPPALERWRRALAGYLSDTAVKPAEIDDIVNTFLLHNEVALRLRHENADV